MIGPRRNSPCARFEDFLIDRSTLEFSKHSVRVMTGTASGAGAPNAGSSICPKYAGSIVLSASFLAKRGRTAGYRGVSSHMLTGPFCIAGYRQFALNRYRTATVSSKIAGHANTLQFSQHATRIPS